METITTDSEHNPLMRQQIKISDVIITDRIRKEVRNIESLAADISYHGLLQPIGIAPDKTLVWGFRRLTAHKHLGLEYIDYVDAREVPEDERAEMEFAENHEREDFTWQEEALGILQIYRLRKRRGALEGWSWGQQQASDLFKMAIGTFNYVLAVAIKLEQELILPLDQRRYHNFQSVNEAYRLGLLADKEDEANRELARRMKERTNNSTQEHHAKAIVDQVRNVEARPELLHKERERYESNELNTIPFEQYWEEKTQEANEIKNTIYLSNRVIQADCIEYMLREENQNRFDHIITDPPYAINMDNLNAANQHGGLAELSRVEDEHDEDENLDLLAKFFPAAFQCTKDGAFVITCGDPMVWQYMYDLAIKAGFAVQRWPLIWHKVNQNVMNNMPSYNSSKDYEIAMVCRKPSAVVQIKQNSSITQASNVEVKKRFGHPFSKPFEWTQKFVEMASTEGQLILDPFAGGGSMVAKFITMKREFIAVEKKEIHYNALLENLKREVYLPLNPNFVFK